MGDAADNITVRAHRRRGTKTTDYSLHRHHGALNIDTVSGPASQRQFFHVRNVANYGDNVKLDAAGEAAWGSWYTENIIGPSDEQYAADPMAATSRDAFREVLQSLTNSE